jgi:hypothetical protein
MNLFIAPAWMRLFLLLGGAVLWIGIWHTGFSVASWILYIPAAMFVIASATGRERFCRPGRVSVLSGLSTSTHSLKAGWVAHPSTGSE